MAARRALVALELLPCAARTSGGSCRVVSEPPAPVRNVQSTCAVGTKRQNTQAAFVTKACKPKNRGWMNEMETSQEDGGVFAWVKNANTTGRGLTKASKCFFGESICMPCVQI
jgi:hypothetical protein